jgi:hypothetical protein
MAGMQTVAGPEALQAAIATCRAAEVDELVLVPTSSAIAELERTVAVLEGS